MTSVPPSECVVLVVDDEQDIREVIAELLAEQGYRVVCAADGRDALNALQGLPSPCCILLDLMMPNMNGWRFLDTLQHTRHKHAPVVVITAESAAPPHCQTLRKPLELDRLLLIVNDHCCR